MVGWSRATLKISSMLAMALTVWSVDVEVVGDGVVVLQRQNSGDLQDCPVGPSVVFLEAPFVLDLIFQQLSLPFSQLLGYEGQYSQARFYQ